MRQNINNLTEEKYVVETIGVRGHVTVEANSTEEAIERAKEKGYLTNSTTTATVTTVTTNVEAEPDYRV